MLLQEKSPFCMLPSPLNLLPALAYPVHNGYIALASRVREWDEVSFEKKKATTSFYSRGCITFIIISVV